MRRNPIRPARNAATVTSFAAFSTVGAPLARLHGGPRQSQRRNRTGSGAWKVSWPSVARSRRGDGAAIRPARPGRTRSACACRAAGWASVEPSTYSTIEWITDCGCQHVDLMVGDGEQVRGLNHLQALVHHGALDRPISWHPSTSWDARPPVRRRILCSIPVHSRTVPPMRSG